MPFGKYKREKKLAKKAFERQLYLSNTAHQREVQDLVAAGLNPILSAKYGGAPGFNVPMGGASSLAQDIGGVTSALGDIAGAGASSAKAASGMFTDRAQRRLLRAQTAGIKTSEKLNKELTATQYWLKRKAEYDAHASDFYNATLQPLESDVLRARAELHRSSAFAQNMFGHLSGAQGRIQAAQVPYWEAKGKADASRYGQAAIQANQHLRNTIAPVSSALEMYNQLMPGGMSGRMIRGASRFFRPGWK